MNDTLIINGTIEEVKPAFTNKAQKSNRQFMF